MTIEAIMAEWVANGRLIDAILVLVAVEAAVLFALCRARGRAAWPLLANLASGAVLLFAVKLALTGAPWTFIAGSLGLALVAHGADLAGRFGSEHPPTARSDAT